MKKLLVMLAVGLMVTFTGCTSVEELNEAADKAAQEVNANEDNIVEEEKEEVEEQPKEEIKEEVKEVQPKETKQVIAKDICGDCGKTFPTTELVYDVNNYARCNYCLLYGTCYDCAGEFLKDEMTYDGSRFHCGCQEEKDHPVKQYCPMCNLYIEELVDYNGDMLCPDCAYALAEEAAAAQHNDNQSYIEEYNQDVEPWEEAWECPTCGTINYGEVLCENGCDWE